MSATDSSRIGTVRDRTSTISRVVTLVAVVVPPVGLLAAMGLLWNVAFHPIDAALFLLFYVVCAFGTTIGFHRYFTHRGFETRRRRTVPRCYAARPHGRVSCDERTVDESSHLCHR